MPGNEQCDVLIPLRLPLGIKFLGHSGRRGAFNGEMAFTLFEWPASFHHTQEYRDAYFIVRTNCEEAAARSSIERILTAFPFAAVMLDVGMRLISSEVKIDDGWSVDLDHCSIMPAGSMPSIHRGSGGPHTLLSGSFAVSVEALSEAFEAASVFDAKASRAAEVYADIDFEASITSKLVLLATVLELLANQGKRDDEALAMIGEWQTVAKSKRRDDLFNALASIRDESKGAAIRRFIAEVCQSAKLSDETIQSSIDAVGSLYRKRSAVLHEAVEVTLPELPVFRRVVRLALTRREGFGPLGGAVDQLGTL